MNARSDNQHVTFLKCGVSLFLGTTANMISTLTTLPLQYIFTQRQLHPENSYRYIVSDTFSYHGIKRVYEQSHNALKMAPKQSVAYLGVSMTALTYFHEDKAWVRSVKAGLLSGVAESVVTANDLQKMISNWNHAKVHDISKSTVYWRSLQGTLLKNLIANPVTLAFYLYSLEELKTRSGSTSPTISGLAGMMSALFAAPVIAPLSTLQTRLQNDPSLTLMQHAKKINSESTLLFWKGCAARGTYKAVDSIIKFGLIGVGQQMLNPHIAAFEGRCTKPAM